MRKEYGKSQQLTCYFCSKTATQKNNQGISVCKNHAQEEVPAKRCVCGEYLDIKESKWGPFFLCKNCGPLSQQKVDAMEVNPDENIGYKLNKSFRQKKKSKIEYDKRRLYTIEELEKLWDNNS